MAAVLFRLARACHDRRGLVLVIWLVVLAGVGTAAATLSGPTTRQFDIPGQESTSAIAQLPRLFPGSGAGLATARVVFEAPPGRKVTDPAFAPVITSAVSELGAAPQVASASNPLDPAAPVVSPDGAAAYSSVSYRVPVQDVSADARAALHRVADEAGSTGLTVELGGNASVTPFELGITGEVVGVVVAVVVLLLTYGALAAASMNMLTALVGVGTGAAGITALTGLVTLQNTTPILAVMLGLAVGIDYALFIVSRARAELRAGRDVRDAVATAVATAGSAVVTAGVTVVIALAGLSIVGIPFLTQMGLAAAGTVVVAVLVALTLLPALLSFTGRRILPRRGRAVAPGSPAPEKDSGLLVRWGRGVTTHRVAALVIGVVAVGALASPVVALRTSLGDDSTASPASTQRRAYDILSEHFGPGVNGPLLVLVTTPGGGAAERGASVVRQVTGLPDVGRVLPPTPNADDTAALVTVVPRSGPSDDATTTLVTTIRDTVARDNSDGTRVAVTGQTAVGVDVSAKLASALPVYLVVVVGLALVLLLVVFRSLLVPVVAAVGYLLTIGAALGSTVAVFQWGWLKSLVNSDTTAPLLSLAPIIVVGILFGLAMDYQVFLVSRIHEAYEHGAAPRAAVVDGFRRAAPVVVAAAVIMFAVFAGFVPQGDATIKPIGFALAVGVIVDALVVRMVLVPAALSLLGRAAWWLPRWLSWIPRVDVEGRALQAQREATPDREPVGAER